MPNLNFTKVLLKRFLIPINRSNVAKFIHYYGWPHFMKRLWYGAMKYLYKNRTSYIFILSAQNVSMPDQNNQIVELTRDDADRLQKIMYISRSGLHKRFDRGDRCFAVLDNRDIMSFFWALYGRRYLPELCLKFNLNSQQAWMYNAITLKHARGKGLYPDIIRYMACTLSRDGIKQLFVDVEVDNEASLRAVAKADCKKVAKIQIRKTLFHSKYYLQVYDKTAWQILKKTIDDSFDINGCVEGYL